MPKNKLARRVVIALASALGVTGLLLASVAYLTLGLSGVVKLILDWLPTGVRRRVVAVIERLTGEKEQPFGTMVRVGEPTTQDKVREMIATS